MSTSSRISETHLQIIIVHAVLYPHQLRFSKYYNIFKNKKCKAKYFRIPQGVQEFIYKSCTKSVRF